MYISLPIIKDDLISCVPNHPASSDDYFPEDNTVKVCSSLQNHIQRAEVQVPNDLNGGLAVPTKRTFKEKMETCFFTSLVT